MGYALLWIENLAVSLLLVATVFSCVGRFRRRWLRDALWMPVPVVLLLWYAGLVYVATVFVFFTRNMLPVSWFVAVVALAVSFIVGAVWLQRRGLRRFDEQTGLTAAASWPRGKLAIALGVAVALHLMTYWNMDLAARQQAENLRGEAGALALSTAPPRIADSDNAAILYEQAEEGVLALVMDPQHHTIQTLGDPSQPGFDPKNPELRRLLQKNTAVLALLRQAASKPNCYFDRDYSWPTMTTDLSHVQHLREGVVLLDLNARAQTADGNTRAAIEDINAMFAASEHARADQFLICLLVSFNIEQRATAALQNLFLHNKLSDEDLAALRIPADTSRRRLIERACRSEEAGRLTTFCEIGSGELTFASVLACNGIPTSKPPLDGPFASAVLGSLYRVFLFGDDLADHRRLSLRIRELAAMPYYKAKAPWDHFEAQLCREPAGLLNRLLLPALQPCFVGIARAGALHEALRLGVAAEKYRLRHGRFPARLEDLAPEFIPVVPLDPFDGKPMRMKRTDHSLIVYSIGPNEIDDGGTPIPPIPPSGQAYPPPGDITFEVPDRKP